MDVEIRLLGGFQVVVDGVPVPDESWTRRHAAALVKLLALAPNRRLLRDQVIDALWPDVLLEQAAPRLHKATHYARSTLGTPAALVVAGETVTLFPAATVGLDVARFDEAAGAAVAGADPDSAAAAAAAELYTGDLLPEDLYEPWAEEPRETLRLRHLQVLRALGRWEQVVAVDRLDEQAHLRLAQEHLRRGDRTAALGQLDRMAAVWQRDLGVDPGEAASALRAEAEALAVDELDWGLRVASRAPVPEPLTPTIGRGDDIEQVSAMLDRAQIVSLVGPGGVGKTRLALEVALRRAGDARVGSGFVDLTRVAEPGQVPGLVAGALGIQAPSASAAEQGLEEALRGRSLLLVMDNFEHVVDAAGIVGRIARWSPGVQVLSTSRARLNIAGEQVFDVAPLPIEAVRGVPGDGAGPGDAIVLFEQAATAVDPQFRLAPHLTDVASICRTVDGLPLGIELAAGHVRTLPPPLLRARLHARLGSPTGAARDVPARQRTLRATIDWSLQLLAEPEQVVFRRLGVFAGAVPLEAVEQVCGGPGVDQSADVVEPLSRLVDQSLVRRVTGPQGEARFVLLELLKERARELLAGTEETEVARSHAQFVADLLDDVDERRWSGAADRWIAIISDHLAEIRKAHEWAERNGEVRLAARITADLGTYWHREGHHPEGRRWVAASLLHVADLDDDLVARLHLSAGAVEWTRDRPLARQHWEQSATRFRATGDERYLAYSLCMVAGTYMGDPDRYEVGVGVCEESIEIARRVGERPLVAQALNVLGELARVQGDDALAMAAYEEGHELAVAAHDEVHVSMFLGNMSFIADHRGDYDEARRLSLEGLRLSWSLGRRMVAAWALSELAGPEIGLGRPELAARLVGAADKALHLLGATLHPGDLPERERVLRALRDLLGPDASERLRGEGARLTLDRAVALALEGADDDAWAAAAHVAAPVSG